VCRGGGGTVGGVVDLAVDWKLGTVDDRDQGGSILVPEGLVSFPSFGFP
jgi:hypothetical protein